MAREGSLRRERLKIDLKEVGGEKKKSNRNRAQTLKPDKPGHTQSLLLPSRGDLGKSLNL